MLIIKQKRMKSNYFSKWMKGVIFALVWVFSLSVFSQNITVRGAVKDTKGEPLIGVTALVQGTSVGTITDVDGNFTLPNIPSNSRIEISYVGMTTQIIDVNGRTNIDVVLSEDTELLDEVVVVGYGTQRKINMTGAVASVSFDDEAIASRATTNVSTALAGMLPGMVVTQGDGTPSADGGTIRIRGTGSLNSGSGPLIVIDGQPGDINTVNPNDVASVSVLKDAASAAIYGSRAANGVILITTKSGSNSDGKISLNYTGSVGKADATRLFDIVSNTADHMSLINQIQSNSGLLPLFTDEFISNWRTKSATDPMLYPNTDWWAATLKANTIQNHTLSARGGNERTNFYTSFGYLDNNGIIDNTGLKKYTFRSNLSYKINDWLSMGSNLTALFSKADPANVDAIFQYFEALTPGVYPKHPDGRYGGAMTGGSEQQAGNNNVIRSIETALGERNTQNYTGKLFAVLTPVQGLEINGSYFIDMYNYNDWSSSRPANTWNFQTETVTLDVESGARLGISNSYTKRQRHVFDLYGSYSKSFANHNFVGLLGYNQEYYKEDWFNASKRDLYSLDIPVLNAAPNEPQAGGSSNDFAMRSYFGRINYDYLGKYLAEANFRYDGSSRFNPDERWGFFPSFSLGWRVSEEVFWDDLRDKITNLKFRASWGQLGNNGIGNYEWQSVYNAANHSFNGRIVQGLAPNSIANANMTWETTDVLNIGADFNFLNHFSLSLDYYNKFTHGILANIPIPFVNGGLTAPRINSAEVRNTGFEVDANYNTRIGDLIATVSANLAFNKNRIENYKGDYLEPHGQGVWTEGQPIGIFWVREIDRIIQDKAEVDALVNDGWQFFPSVPGPGDFLYKDANGDKIINDQDRVLKGNPIPALNYGGSVNLAYRGFDFYTLINGIAGWDKYLNAQFFSLQPRVDGYLYPTQFLNSWTTDNKSTLVPKLYTNNPKNNQQSDYYLHDASFFRVKTIQLGYTLPTQLTQKIFVEKLRLYVNLENYFIFTSYPGMDPENDGSRYNGSITYPLMKTLSFGLNINL
ncbi:SusC/RagA family TonB-linked outer membrane protein [Petrimonas sp.]|uniref:SusC/RagA family TonB-linked outer membrane protein n=1 Tax=Petrimonas sp. TaxID=2023866 RepID=UPI003F5107AF